MGSGIGAEVDPPVEVVARIRALPEVGQVLLVVVAVGSHAVPRRGSARVPLPVDVDRGAERMHRPARRPLDVATVVSADARVQRLLLEVGADVVADVPADVTIDVRVVVDVPVDPRCRLRRPRRPRRIRRGAAWLPERRDQRVVPVRSMRDPCGRMIVGPARAGAWPGPRTALRGIPRAPRTRRSPRPTIAHGRGSGDVTLRASPPPDVRGRRGISTLPCVAATPHRRSGGGWHVVGGFPVTAVTRGTGPAASLGPVPRARRRVRRCRSSSQVRISRSTMSSRSPARTNRQRLPRRRPRGWRRPGRSWIGSWSAATRCTGSTRAWASSSVSVCPRTRRHSPRSTSPWFAPIACRPVGTPLPTSRGRRWSAWRTRSPSARRASVPTSWSSSWPG